MAYLIKEQSLREPANIEFPCSRITDPTFTWLCRIAIITPCRMWEDLHQLLWLRVAVGITQVVRFLQMFCISRRAVHVICAIGEVGRVSSVYSCAIRESVERRACIKVSRRAPCCCIWIQYHLAVASNISRYISITWLAVVLPTASHVHEVELALGSSTLFDI